MLIVYFAVIKTGLCFCVLQRIFKDLYTVWELFFQTSCHHLNEQPQFRHFRCCVDLTTGCSWKMSRFSGVCITEWISESESVYLCQKQTCETETNTDTELNKDDTTWDTGTTSRRALLLLWPASCAGCDDFGFCSTGNPTNMTAIIIAVVAVLALLIGAIGVLIYKKKMCGGEIPKAFHCVFILWSTENMQHVK